jgi:AcrR family transcriptional regulator
MSRIDCGPLITTPRASPRFPEGWLGTVAVNTVARITGAEPASPRATGASTSGASTSGPSPTRSEQPGTGRGGRRPGRPRSERADQAILAAALDLLAELGPAALGIEQVAARAGVGKATIYRRWPGKEEMLLDALGRLAIKLPQPQGRSVRADLTALLTAICRDGADPQRARLFALLQGEGAHYPRLVAKYVETVVQPRRDIVRSVLRRGIGTGELRENADIEAAAFLLEGAVLASMYSSQPPEPRYARRVVEELLRGLAAR